MKTCHLNALAYKQKTTGLWLCFEYRNDTYVVSLMKDFDPLCCIVRDETILNNSFYDWHYHKATKLNEDDLIPVEVFITYNDAPPLDIEIQFT